MSKLFFNPSECNELHPPPFAREAKKVYLFYSARFSHFIDSLKPLQKKWLLGFTAYLVLIVLTFDQEE
jgi:hypothetical protein